MKEKGIVARLVGGERLFVAGGVADGTIGAPDVRHWYQKVKYQGKYLHTAKVEGGIEMWADDEPGARRGVAGLRRNKYESAP